MEPRPEELGELDGVSVTHRTLSVSPGEPGRSDPDTAEGPFEAEREAWRQLHRACRSSIAGGHAIVFH